MKKILLIITMLVGAGLMQAQTYNISHDSMNNSPNPGKYFINYLKTATENPNPTDTNEAGEKVQDIRSLNFWRDRMPAGHDNVDSPFYKYSYMMKNYTRGGCNPAPGAFNGNWENTGPQTVDQRQARVYCEYIDPLDNDKIIMGVGNAGLWKTTNGGLNWVCTTDGANIPAGAGVNCLAVNPFNKQEVYIGTKVEGGDRRDIKTWGYGQGVWKSTDFGSTWTQELLGINAFQSMDEMAFCPWKVNGGTDVMIIATDYSTVWQKIGSNGTWTNITPPGTPSRLIRDITFTTNVYGKFYLSTQHNWIGGFIGPRIYEGTVAANGTVTWNTNFMNEDNFGNNFQFNGAAPDLAMGFETAYDGNNLLYMIVAALNGGLSAADEGHHSIYSYNITTGLWAFEYAMPLDVDQKNMWTMGIEVDPLSPNVFYLMETQPYRARKDALGFWHSDILGPYNAPNFHADIRSLQIGSVDPLDYDNDKVFWGTDGGLSRTIGNVATNLNGQGFWTSEVYDVDVSLIGRKRIAASFDNGLYNTTNTNLWDINVVGDGFDAIYDKRFTPLQPRVLTNINAAWQTFQHNNTIPFLSAGGFGFTPPIRTGFGEIDALRPFTFPHAFDVGLGLMFAGNRNLLQSQPNGYGVWGKLTTTGDLNGFAATVNDHCRAIAVSPHTSVSPSRKYFGLRFPDPIGGIYRVFFAQTDPTAGSLWRDHTPPEIKYGAFNLTDIIYNPNNPKRVYISLGMVRWAGPDFERVLVGDYDPILDIMVWNPMSTGLPQLPVTRLAYQNGSDDIIYAGTDGGVYRWDKPQQCWVKFDDSPSGINGKMANVIVQDLEIDYCSGKLVMGSYSRGIWETDLYYPNTFPANTEIISQNTTWNSDRIVAGSVEILPGFSLTITGTPNQLNNTATSSSTTIHMPKFGRIDVHKGAKLIIDGAHIINDCKVDWMGIFAHGDGGQPQVIGANGLDPNHGIVQIQNNSIIENAEEALNNGGGSDNPNTGGIIQIENSHFVNNHRSAAFSQYHNLTSGDDLSYFHGNRFDIDDNIPVPFYAHISMWDVSGIDISLENIFNNDQTLTSFTPSHLWAVYSIDAGYDFTGNYVNKMYKGIESSGFNNTFGPTYPIKIRDNHFVQNEIGIHLMTTKFPIVKGNEILIGAKQTAGVNAYYSLGTKMESVNQFNYSWNYLTHIQAYNVPSVFVYTAGTEVYDTGDMFENIYKNSYEKLLIGNDGSGNCSNVAGNIGLNYMCNTNILNTGWDFIFQGDPEIRKFQTGNCANCATGNVLSLPEPTCVSWNHTLPGNGPVKYFYDPIALNETPNALSFNVNLSSTPIASGCSSISNFGIEDLATFDYEAISSGEMNSMKDQFTALENSYNTSNTLYLQLLDEGNTAELVEGIENATIAEQLITRAEFLGISPYVSQTALQELALSQIVSNPILLEILLANPDATRSETFIEFLKNDIPTPLPNYMIDLIRASWTSAVTPRALLEQNISIAVNNMTILKGHIVRTYSVNDSLRNSDSLLAWMKKIPSIRNSYEIVEYYLRKREFAISDSLLNAIPITFNLRSSDSIERSAFITLYNFKKSLLEDSLEINQLDSTRKATLIAIADATDYTFPRTMARSALCFFYQICYPDTVRELPNSNGNKTLPINKQLDKMKEITVYPNPANEYVVCYYNLASKSNEAEVFLVSDVTGKQVYKAVLKGAQGQHIWDTRNVGNGNYIYTVITSSGEKYSGKVMIQK